MFTMLLPALLLQAQPPMPTDLGATGPRQMMGFGKYYCSLNFLPVNMHGGGGSAWGIWQTKPTNMVNVDQGEFTFGIDSKPGAIWSDMRALALRFSVTLAPGIVVERTRLLVDGKPSKLKFTLRRFNDPAVIQPELEGRKDEPYEQLTSEAVIRALLPANSAAFRFYDRRGKQVASAEWDVGKVHWMPAALKKNGFTCR